MRKFKYSRGNGYSVVVKLHPDGMITFADVVVPHKMYTEEYNEVVDKMMDNAEKEMIKLLKEEADVKTKMG